MKRTAVILPLAFVTLALAQSDRPVPVTADNFIRAESDLYFRAIVDKGGFGKFAKTRDVTPVEQLTATHANRDTLYSAAVFDLDPGPVTITIPDTGKRFISMQVVTQDEYTPMVAYDPGTYTLTRDQIGTRYVLATVRILVHPAIPKDLDRARALQDAVQVDQQRLGTFETPNWDRESQRSVREALLALADTLPDTRGMFGAKDQVDPVRRLIGAASAWGGTPQKDAKNLTVVPARNDGRTVHTLVVKDAPVDGFWSITVYNARGLFEPNPRNTYTVNSLTAKKARDGTVAVQFGGCGPKTANCLPIMSGWSYTVRLYRPGEEILNGSWQFPIAEPVPRPLS